MPDSVKKTSARENDELKKQLEQLTRDFESMKAKMVERNEAMTDSLPNEEDIHFLKR